MNAINISKSGFKRNTNWLQALMIMAIVLLPISAYALEQAINASFTGNLGTRDVYDWTEGITQSAAYAAGGIEICGYDEGADANGSVFTYIRVPRKVNDVFGTTVTECYQNLFGGTAIASAANVEVRISDYYQCNVTC